MTQTINTKKAARRELSFHCTGCLKEELARIEAAQRADHADVRRQRVTVREVERPTERIADTRAGLLRDEGAGRVVPDALAMTGGARHADHQVRVAARKQRSCNTLVHFSRECVEQLCGCVAAVRIYSTADGANAVTQSIHITPCTRRDAATPQ